MKKLLYVDDDQEQLDLYEMAFNIHAPDVIFYKERNPFNAIKSIQELKPDIVLLDLVMAKEMSGFDVLKLIREDGGLKNIQVVAFTNSMLPSVVSRLNELGVTEIWEKIKGTPDLFAKKISEILENKK